MSVFLQHAILVLITLVGQVATGVLVHWLNRKHIVSAVNGAVNGAINGSAEGDSK